MRRATIPLVCKDVNDQRQHRRARIRRLPSTYVVAFHRGCFGPPRKPIRRIRVLLLGNVIVLRRLLDHRRMLAMHPHRRHSSSSPIGGQVTWKTREFPLCWSEPSVTGHLVGGVQAFAENHVHRVSAYSVRVRDDFRQHLFDLFGCLPIWQV